MANDSEVLTIENGVVVKCKEDALSVVIPEGVEKIGEDAFAWCKSLESVVIPDGVMELEDFAFNRCVCLSSIVIPEGVEKIGENAFGHCSALKSISIPSSVKEIHKDAFEGCEGVEKIESASPLFPYDEKAGKLYDATGKRRKPILCLRKVIAKSAKIEQINKVSAISLFLAAINEREIPDSSAKIVYSTKTESIFLVNIRENNVFFKLSSKVNEWMGDVPKVVEILADEEKSGQEIYDCLMQTALKPIAVPKKVDYEIKLVSVNGKLRFFSPGSIKRMSSDFYEKAKYLELYGMTQSEDCEDAFAHQTSLKSVVLPSDMKYIGHAMFYYCLALESIKIPEGVTEIQSVAFASCSSLESIEIPEGVTEIQDYAFASCTSLKSVVIPSSVKKIGEEVFKECTSLSEVTFNGTMEQWNVVRIYKGFYSIIKKVKCIDGEWVLEIDENCLTIEKGAVCSCDKNAKVVEIPEDVNLIKEEAFKDCKALRALLVYEKVEKIEKDAFSGCTSLEKIVFSGFMKQWRKIIKCADWNKDIPAKSVKCRDGEISFVGDVGYSIKNDIFIGCECYIENVEIPEGVKEISSYAFWCCTALKSVVIPSSVSVIGKGAFSRCYSLESVVIPEGVTKIDEFAFVACSSLKSISIPASVKEICKDTFEWCDKVEKIESASLLFPFDEKTGKLYDARGKRRKTLLSLAKDK